LHAKFQEAKKEILLMLLLYSPFVWRFSKRNSLYCTHTVAASCVNTNGFLKETPTHTAAAATTNNNNNNIILIIFFHQFCSVGTSFTGSNAHEIHNNNNSNNHNNNILRVLVVLFGILRLSCEYGGGLLTNVML